MKAMILAAGRGERMRPLTDTTPKPLLLVGGRPLIDWHLQALAGAGFTEIVINVAHLADQIVGYCGSGEHWGVSIAYSVESQALETAGGILQALPLLGDAPFAVVNGDVWTTVDYQCLRQHARCPAAGAYLLMVANPPHHPQGDFALRDNGCVVYRDASLASYTYAGMGIYNATMFADMAPGKIPLRPLLEQAIEAQQLTGEVISGRWEDVGTPERLAELNRYVAAGSAADV